MILTADILSYSDVIIHNFIVGWVWAKNPMEQPNWEIEVTFRVSGRGRIGADGLVGN